MERTLTIVSTASRISKAGRQYQVYVDYDKQEWVCFIPDVQMVLVNSIKEKRPVECEVDNNMIVDAWISETPIETIVSEPVKKKSFDNTTMYVSYAKDIFIELNKNPGGAHYDALMETAVNLVKRAREAFEK